jgi:nucleoside-diphosphate kinase
MEKTLVILKPDTIQRALVGEITNRFEKKGLKLVATKMFQFTDSVLKEHYSHIADKPFFPRIADFMKSSPVILQVWEGRDAVKTMRQLVGYTNARDALPGTVRGDFAMSIQCNTVHASEDLTNAEEEINRFFSINEIFSYERNENILYAKDEQD